MSFLILNLNKTDQKRFRKLGRAAFPQNHLSDVSESPFYPQNEVSDDSETSFCPHFTCPTCRTVHFMFISSFPTSRTPHLTLISPIRRVGNNHPATAPRFHLVGFRLSRGFRLSAPPTAVLWPRLRRSVIQNSKFKIQNSFFVGVSPPSEHFADAVNGCDEGVDLGLGVVEREGGADGALYA